jgi:transporter family-2 protein
MDFLYRLRPRGEFTTYYRPKSTQPNCARLWKENLMTLKIVFALLAIATGVALAMQAAANAGLAKLAGLGPALVVNTAIVLIGAIGLWAALGAKSNFFPAGASWTLYVGGLFGFVIIASLAFAFPKIGAAYAIALMVGGQCVAALMIDHFGLMGMPCEPLTIQRVIGVALVAAGAVVMRV